jgi:hypothetical protein
MNAVIRFNLNEKDDRMAHMRCIKSTDMALALCKIQEVAMEYEHINIIQLNDIFEQYNITLNEIIC